MIKRIPFAVKAISALFFSPSGLYGHQIEAALALHVNIHMVEAAAVYSMNIYTMNAT